MDNWIWLSRLILARNMLSKMTATMKSSNLTLKEHNLTRRHWLFGLMAPTTLKRLSSNLLYFYLYNFLAKFITIAKSLLLWMGINCSSKVKLYLLHNTNHLESLCPMSSAPDSFAKAPACGKGWRALNRLIFYRIMHS